MNVSLPEGRWKIIIQPDNPILVELDDWMMHHFSTTNWMIGLKMAEKNTLVSIESSNFLGEYAALFGVSGMKDLRRKSKKDKDRGKSNVLRLPENLMSMSGPVLGTVGL